jgi:uncharacterized protein (DUF2267 family)
MDHEAFLDRVQRWGAMTRQEAELAISATLGALRDTLPDAEADALARDLSPPLAHLMRGRAQAARLGANEFYKRVSRYEGVPTRFAIEHAQAVCQAMASVLSPSCISSLARAAPELAPLFEVPDRESHPATVLSAHGQTLAEGHPGSDHPLSEAHPARPGGSPSR